MPLSPIAKCDVETFDKVIATNLAEPSLFCRRLRIAISAKRFALFLKDSNNNPSLLRKGKNIARRVIGQNMALGIC
jgi:hypothetical protein